MTIVAKFGGTSVATADAMRKVATIVRSDPDRRYVVVSAPGKRFEGDTKVTDLLIRGTTETNPHRMRIWAMYEFELRLRELMRNLDSKLAVHEQLRTIKKHGATVTDRLHREFIFSRGEYYSALLLAELLDWEMVDAADFIVFDGDGNYDPAATQAKFDSIQFPERAVIPGFYGTAVNGTVRTFSRGGSDISGAIVASLVNATAYENWTDVDGVQAADPRIISGSPTIPVMTYRELRELAYRGASVLHEDALFPVREKNIPVLVRNTNNPDGPGTRIVAERPPNENLNSFGVVGIASKPGFEEVMMWGPGINDRKGFLYRVLGVFLNAGLRVDHTPDGIDTQSVILDSQQYARMGFDRTQFYGALVRECSLESLEHQRLSMICVVGETMSHKRGIAARALSSLDLAGINTSVIVQNGKEMNILIGVAEKDHHPAVHALYRAFFS